MSLQNAWYEDKKWVWLLLPFSLLFFCISRLRRWFFSVGIFTSHKPKAFVIIVGNISVGGNGKTPSVIAIVDYLQRKGHACGVLSRGYGGSQTAFPHHVLASDEPQLVGDEPKLMQHRLACPVVIDPKRVRGANYLVETHQCDVIICDDGLQHYALKRDFEIVVMDGRGIGNGFLLPMGPLRESKERINSVDALIFNGAKSDNISLDNTTVSMMDLAPTGWVNVKTSARISSLNVESATAIAGIGDPKRFFATLATMGIHCQETIAFPDHYAFSATDIPDGMVLMTEKDAVKCKDFAHDNCWYLQVSGIISSNLYHAIDDKLNAFQR